MIYVGKEGIRDPVLFREGRLRLDESNEIAKTAMPARSN